MELRFDSVSLAMHGRPILAALTGVLMPGRVTVILGANGAGKSTLLTCLAGLRAPDQGTITLAGEQVLSLPPRVRAQRIGLLPQRGEVHWDIDAQTLVGLGRLPHCGRWGMTPTDHAAVAAALAATDCTQLALRSVQRMSGGEQARVLLARVLAGAPAWLLADEPLASLDPAHQLDVLEQLRQRAQQGVGVVVVLHDLTQAARIADDVLILREGHLLASGRAADVLTPDVLAAAYDVQVHVSTSSAGERIIVPLRRSPAPQRDADHTAGG